MRPAAATLLVVAWVILAGCGDGDGDEPATSDRATVPTEAQEVPERRSGADVPREEPGPEPAEEDGAGAERAIRTAIEDALASADPERACEAAVTEAYLRDAYGDAAGCRGAQSAGFAAEIVEIGPISVEGDRARTTVRVEGGPYVGERLRARLVREGRAWRLDRLRSNVPPGP